MTSITNEMMEVWNEGVKNVLVLDLYLWYFFRINRIMLRTDRFLSCVNIKKVGRGVGIAKFRYLTNRLLVVRITTLG